MKFSNLTSKQDLKSKKNRKKVVDPNQLSFIFPEQESIEIKPSLQPKTKNIKKSWALIGIFLLVFGIFSPIAKALVTGKGHIAAAVESTQNIKNYDAVRASVLPQLPDSKSAIPMVILITLLVAILSLVYIYKDRINKPETKVPTPTVNVYM